MIETAAHTHTIIEINNQSLNPGSSRYNGDETVLEILKACKKYNVPVLASSDAHFCTLIGNFNCAKKLIDSIEMDETLVLNTSVERFLAAIERKKAAK